MEFIEGIRFAEALGDVQRLNDLVNQGELSSPETFVMIQSLGILADPDRLCDQKAVQKAVEGNYDSVVVVRDKSGAVLSKHLYGFYCGSYSSRT